MRRNRHDTWKLFCDNHQELLAGMELPASVTHSEHRFRVKCAPEVRPVA